ncbi:DUF397 domain-containing protein [Actinomadura gamaensis]|uniref:DUF397 domain-containing protein n=1 Tax=Actinomadura gamaensis TaxID=1763541 RepID=A0ABV9UAA3_9ACTN
MSKPSGAENRFHKSSYSDGGNGCVEVAASEAGCSVRDSKDADGPVLAADAASWQHLLEHVKRSDLARVLRRTR